MAVLETVTAAAGGGLFGLIGTAFGRVAGFFERKQAFEFKQKEWENDRFEEQHELALLEINERHAQNENEREIAISDNKGSWSGLNASLAAQTALNDNPQGSAWVLDALRLVRPVITLMLWIIAAAFFVMTKDSSIIETVVFAATTATVWWFGERAPKQSPKESLK